MKNIVLIATGGTIASAREAGGAVNAGLTGETLLAALHAPLDGIAVTVENFAAAGSYALDLATVFRLCRRIDAVFHAFENLIDQRRSLIVLFDSIEERFFRHRLPTLFQRPADESIVSSSDFRFEPIGKAERRCRTMVERSV